MSPLYKKTALGRGSEFGF